MCYNVNLTDNGLVRSSANLFISVLYESAMIFWYRYNESMLHLLHLLHFGVYIYPPCIQFITIIGQVRGRIVSKLHITSNYPQYPGLSFTFPLKCNPPPDHTYHNNPQYPGLSFTLPLKCNPPADHTYHNNPQYPGLCFTLPLKCNPPPDHTYHNYSQYPGLSFTLPLKV